MNDKDPEKFTSLMDEDHIKAENCQPNFSNKKINLNLRASDNTMKGKSETAQNFSTDYQGSTNDDPNNQSLENIIPNIGHKRSSYTYSSSYDEDLEHKPPKNFFQRTFGPMEAGSIRSSIFSLVCFVLGTGCFSIPYTFNKMGVLIGVTAVIFAGITSVWSLYLLIYSSEKKGIRDYKLLVKDVLGSKAATMVDVLIVLYQFFIIVGFVVSTYQIISNIAYILHYRSSRSFLDFTDFLDNGPLSPMYWKFGIIFGLGILIVLPLCLMKDLSKLRVFSIIGLLLLVYNILVLIIQCPTYVQYNIDNSVPYNWYDPTVNGFGSELLFFPAVANIYYSLNTALACFPIYNELKGSSVRRVNKVFLRAVVAMTIILLVIGIVGYLTMPVNTSIYVIFREPIGENDLDLALTIGKVMYVASLTVTIANNYIVQRMTLVKMLFADGELTTKRNLQITLPMIGLILLLASVYQKISSYLSIVGGFMAVISIYVLPVWVYVKVNDYGKWHWKNILSVIVGGIFTVLGFAGGIVSIMNIVNQIRGK